MPQQQITESPKPRPRFALSLGTILVITSFTGILVFFQNCARH